MTAREVLDKGAHRIETRLTDQPLLQAQLMDTIGDVFRTLGLCRRAEELLRSAADTRTAALGPDAPETLQSMTRLGGALSCEGKNAEAEAILRQAVTAEKRVLGQDDDLTQHGMHLLAVACHGLGRDDEAAALYREILERRGHGERATDQFTLGVTGDLASLVASQHPETALHLVQDLLPKLRSSVGEDDPVYVVQMVNLVADQASTGDLAGAALTGEQALPLARRVLGDANEATMNLIRNLSLVYLNVKRYDDAVAVGRLRIDLMRRARGADDPETLQAMEFLSSVYKRQTHYAEAEQLRQEVLSAKRRTLGEDHADVANLYYNIACVQALQGKRRLALDSLRESVTRGFADADGMSKDEDLGSLHNDSRFAALIGSARKNAAAASAATSATPSGTQR